tara:strand:+ start:368 stop:490 length:123 start_codon:yes stop_codon:yes gene_type:complete
MLSPVGHRLRRLYSKRKKREKKKAFFSAGDGRPGKEERNK